MRRINRTRKYSGGVLKPKPINIALAKARMKANPPGAQAGKKRAPRPAGPTEMHLREMNYYEDIAAPEPVNIAKKCETAATGTPLRNACNYIIKQVKSKMPTPLPGDGGKKALRGGRKTKRRRRRKPKRTRRGRSKTRRHRRR